MGTIWLSKINGNAIPRLKRVEDTALILTNFSHFLYSYLVLLLYSQKRSTMTGTATARLWLGKRVALVAALALLCVKGAAQFSVTGTDPGALRWRQMETENFRLVFPVGNDSLARVYGAELENARIKVARSSGFLVGQSYKTKMPVVLHSRYVLPNASVVWAPKRMDIFTVNDPYSPTAMPWVRNLALHEGRHSAQMQFGAAGRYKVLHWLLGEMAAGAFAGIYPGPTILEGDAVVAETALSRSGRGRQADFLGYMMPAFDCGDWRDYYKWSYGSFKRYTPDHYRAGYMLTAGARVFFDDPLFTNEYFDRVTRKGWLFNLQKTVKAASGKSFRKSFRDIEEGFQRMWSEEAALREPFMPSRQVTEAPKLHTEYKGTAASENYGLFSLKSGLAHANSLVRIGVDGKERRIRSFASYTSGLSIDPEGQRLFWSESVGGRRWSLGGSSRIRYVEMSNPENVRDLTRKGRYFNPAPSPDGKVIAATEYPYPGGSRLVLLEASDGSALKSYIAPDSLQFTESAWIGERLFSAGLSENGIGIYEIVGQRVDGKAELEVLLEPRPVSLSHLRVVSGKTVRALRQTRRMNETAGLQEETGDGAALSFLCDRTGVTELYSLDIGTAELLQLTSTRYGIGSPVFSANADTLYYSSLAASDRPQDYRQGRMIYATAVSELPCVPASFGDIHKYRVAEALTGQEAALGYSEDEGMEVSFTQPKRYSKVRLPNIHSWAPVYFNYDNISSISFDNYYKSASLGATALFQYLLGTGYGFVGYGAHEDPDKAGSWRHSGHLSYTFTGFYPVLEISADFNDRAGLDIQRHQLTKGQTSRIYNKGTLTGRPYFDGSVKAYIPFNFSSGGISRGLVPQVRYRITNDRFNDQIILSAIEEKDGKEQIRRVMTLNEERISALRTLDFSVRGYVMRQRAVSQVFPSLGIGAEIGVHTRPGHTDSYSGTAYLYTYGYLPGIGPRQGLRLTASFETDLGCGGPYSCPEGALTAIPRGFVDSNLKSVLNTCSGSRMRVTADYAIPFLDVDWSFLSPIAYIKNFELTPFFDWSYQTFSHSPVLYYNPGGVTGEHLFSAGADLTVNLGNFFWLPYDTRAGIRYSRNFWHNLDYLPVSNLNANYFGWIFSVSL